MHLADACALLSFFGASGSDMSDAGRAAMTGDVLISPITVWELTRKASLGKLPPLPTQNGSFARHLTALGYQTASLICEDAERANRLPPHHKDPMDRMLIATAQRLGCPIITSDGLFATYDVDTVW